MASSTEQGSFIGAQKGEVLGLPLPNGVAKPVQTNHELTGRPFHPTQPRTHCPPPSSANGQEEDHRETGAIFSL